MKKRNLLLLLSAVALLAGCFTKVKHETFLVLIPWAKDGTTNPAVRMGGGVMAYAFAADTAQWDVLSYEDALNGIITSRTTGETMQATAKGASYAFDGAFSLAMELEGSCFLILAVDLQHRLYGFARQDIGADVPETYVNVTFYPEDVGKSYMRGKWYMRNDFYVEPEPEPEPDPEDPVDPENPEQDE